jgi:four helix bundle protein
MMKYTRFEELPVWNDAIELKCRIDEYCLEPSVSRQRALVAQIDAASLSISNNIAEGFERGTTSELIYFLYVARGSAGEVRSMLRYQERRPDSSRLISQIVGLIAQSESISRQIRAWADSLQNTDIRGQKYLTDQVRTHYRQSQRAHELWEKFQAEHRAKFETGVTKPPGETKSEI